MDEKDQKIDALEKLLQDTQKKLDEALLKNRILLFTLDRVYEGISVMFKSDHYRVGYYSKSNQIHDIFKHEDVIGHTVGELWGPVEQEATCHSTKPRIDRKLIYQKPDGKEAQMVFSTYPYYEDGKRLAFVALRRDVTNMNTFIMKTYELQKQLNHVETTKINQNGTKYTLSSIIGDNPALIKTVELARQSAKHRSNILIYGETGTGKELFAQGIHNAGSSCDGPFIAVNCAAIPENLLESILFGSTKGSFTDAREKTGLFEQAEGGTLFLDEVNSMPKSMQVKLLRVLQENTVRRIGGNKDIPVNCRIISAMNITPELAVEQDLIRRDLYYRLGVVVIGIPPLRQRKDDLPLLFDAFIKKYNQKLSKSITTADAVLMDAFERYEWPGNVRELEHMIECAMNFVDDQQNILTLRFMPTLDDHFDDFTSTALPNYAPSNTFNPSDGLEHTLEKLEKEMITKTLSGQKGNVSSTAKILGISRESLYRRMKRLKIEKILLCK
ncbi:MAG: sigma 54-interacting transcriptional regulator [Eubacterium sp.]